MTARYNSSDNTLKEISQMEKPVKPKMGLAKSSFDGAMERYTKQLAAYEKYVASLRTLPCSPECVGKFIHDCEYEAGKDYEVRACCENHCNGVCEQIRTTIWVFPLVPGKSEDKEYWEDVVIKVENYLKSGKKLKDMVYDFQKEYSLSRKQ